MRDVREVRRNGLEYLETVTALLQRVRVAYPTGGLYHAADLQWWWRIPRSTDHLPQLFWFDDLGRPEAAVIATDWGDGHSALYEETTLVVIVMPDATPDWVAHVVERGLAHARMSGIGAVEVEVDRADDVMCDVLVGHGFTIKEDGVVECWLDADARPQVSPLHDDYRLLSRLDTIPGPHHMVTRSGPDVEQRLRQASLYRADLDLLIVDRNDDTAAYGLFWYDRVSATGVVEPMRTERDHQRRGLARHVLTARIDRLAEVGAERISIGFEPGNPASSHLYLDVGFERDKQTDVYAGPTGVARDLDLDGDA